MCHYSDYERLQKSVKFTPSSAAIEPVIQSKPAAGAVTVDLTGHDLTVDILGTDKTNPVPVNDLKLQGSYTITASDKTKIKGRKSKWSDGLMFAIPVSGRPIVIKVDKSPVA